MAIGIDIKDGATPVVRAAMEGLRARNINAVLARAAVNFTREYLFRLDRERPNKMSDRRTHFFAQGARGTHSTILADGFVVSINQVGFRQRLEGGTIKPRVAKLLTIPAHPEAYGRRAREFNDLRFVVLGGYPALVKAEQSEVRFGRQKKDKSRTVTRGRRTGGEVYYWLARSVTQKGDRSVLPQESEYRRVLGEVLVRYAKRVVEK